MTLTLMDQENMIGSNHTLIRMMTGLLDTESSMLSAARGLLGQLHLSETCTRILNTAQFIEISKNNCASLTFLADRLVEDLFLEASYQFLHATKNSNKIQTTFKRKITASNQAVAFIRGTGLELMIETYDLGLDADYLRYEFFRRCKTL